MPKIICKGAQNKGFFGADAITTGMQIGGKKMPRYIDADALKHNIRFEMMNISPQQKKGCVFALQCIDQQPTADVVEVKHGKWVFVGKDVEQCSECQKAKPAWALADYCPRCGAKMDGERRTDEEPT